MQGHGLGCCLPPERGRAADGAAAADTGALGVVKPLPPGGPPRLAVVGAIGLAAMGRAARSAMLKMLVKEGIVVARWFLLKMFRDCSFMWCV